MNYKKESFYIYKSKRMNVTPQDEVEEDAELTHIYHEELVEDIQHTKKILGCYDSDILNPEDISYVEWFDDYEKCPILKINLSYSPHYMNMDEYIKDEINENLIKFISIQNIALKEVEIVDLYINPQFFKILQTNKKIEYFHYELNHDEYEFSDDFYDFLKKNDTVKHLSFTNLHFDMNKLLDSIYENKGLECFVNRVSSSRISQIKDSRFEIKKIDSIPSSMTKHNPGQFYLIEGTIVFSFYYLVTKVI